VPSVDGEYFAYFDPVEEGESNELIISTAEGKIVARYPMDPGFISWSNAGHLMVVNPGRNQATLISKAAGTFVIVSVLAVRPGTVPHWALSGTKLAYVRGGREDSAIATFDLQQLEAMPVPLPPHFALSNPILLFWSPGGLELYFLNKEGKDVVLDKLGVVSGAIQELSRSRADWGSAVLGLPQISPDGTRIYLPPPLDSVVDADLGGTKWVLPAQAQALWSPWSADGKLFYYFRADSPAEVYAHEFESLRDQLIVRNASPNGFFSLDGGSYFFRPRSRLEAIGLGSDVRRWLAARWGWRHLDMNTGTVQPLGRQELWPWAMTGQGRILMSRDDYVRVHYGLYDPNARILSEYRIPADREDLLRRFRSHSVILVTITLYGLFGLIIYLIRPESAPVRALSIISLVVMCVVTGFGLTQLVQPAQLRWNFTINAVDLMGRGWYPLLHRVRLMKDLTVLFLVSVGLLPPSILHFAAVFPEGNRFLTHQKGLGIALYAASLLPILGITWALAGYRPLEAFEPLIAGLVLLGAGVAIIAAVLSLLHNYRHPPHRRAKAQIRWVAMACVLPLAGALAVLIPYGLLHSLLSQWPQAGSSTLGPGTLGALGLLTPLTIGYALVARRPLEVQLVVRRVIFYSILMILGLEVYTLVAGGLGWVMTGSYRNPPHLVVTVSILLAASVLALTWRKLGRVIDRTLARTQYDLRKTLENFAEGLPEILDRPTLVKTLAKTVPEALKARSFYLFTADSTTNKLRLVPALAKIPPQVQGIEFDPAEPLCQYLLKKHRPFEVEVSPYDPRLIPIFRDAAVRLSALGAAVIVGLERRRRLAGLMVLGGKEPDEFFSTEDLELLMLVAHHAAIAIETSDVFEAVAQKRELQKELEVASELQAQVFPIILPETQGCQVAAQCIPAQLVSGDYYDVLELPKQKIALAIGRVSGKGVSASLAIVRLQGLLRTQAPLAENPANLVRRINRHLYSSSRGGKYCTFFYAVYDPTERRLEFVNAGQNPPVALSRQGTRLLESTGVPLGLFPEVTPEARIEILEPGAIVVLSSDGVTQARSEVGERYSMDRLIKVVRGSPESDAGRLLERLLNDVRAFTGDVPVEDDRTLVLLKVSTD